MKSVKIGSGTSSAEILDYGATIAQLVVQAGGGPRSLVLSLPNLEDYPRHGAFFGAIAGRCANRIAGGKFSLDGRDYQLSLNEKGTTQLHGGAGGLWNRTWKIGDASGTHALLTYHSPDGEEGYPGNLDVTCLYKFEDETCLSIALSATTDAPTIVNLATHSYFNLSPASSILSHALRMPAARVCPVNEQLIPTGELLDVTSTGYDFSRSTMIAANRAKVSNGFDHNFALYDAPSSETRFMCKLVPPEKDMALEIWSTEPGLQFYDGFYLPLKGIDVRDGRNVQFGGCCLEPQRYPDAVHHPHFPPVVLRPGETYRQRTEYRFTTP
jgi:aldose 1-epimerase